MSTNFDINNPISSIDFNDPISVARFEVQRKISNNAESIKSQARNIIDKMEALIRDIDSGGTINSLGELQGRGPELDRLCGVRSELLGFRDTLDYVAERSDS